MKPVQYLMALSLATALTACAQPVTHDYYTQNHYTNPTYMILSSEGNVQMREYQSLLAAEITVDGDRETASNKGFIALNNYFQGSSDTGEKIAMTQPVMQFPVFRNMQGNNNMRSVDNRKWIVRFFLPVEYSRDTAPKPKNANIRILETNAMQVATINFSGPWTNDNIQGNENTLRNYMDNNGLRPLDVPIYAFYDSPMTPVWSRHNEVMFKLAD
jgi:hypothetical protein